MNDITRRSGKVNWWKCVSHASLNSFIENNKKSQRVIEHGIERWMKQIHEKTLLYYYVLNEETYNQCVLDLTLILLHGNLN